MAARSGAGTGVVVALVVFVLSTIFLLIFTIVFYSKEQRALEASDIAQTALAKYIKPLEQNSEKFKAVVAQRGGGSAMNHLLRERDDIMTKVLGNPSAGLNDLTTQLQGYGGRPDDTYRNVLDDQQAKLRQAKSEITGMQSQVDQLEKRVREKDALIEQTRKAGDENVQAVLDSIDQFVSDVQDYADDVIKAKAEMGRIVDQLERTFDTQIDSLERQLDNVRADLATRQRQLAEMQDKLGTYQDSTTDPSKLVDGRVIDSARNDQVFINRGRRDHIALGMTFEVYDSASMLGVDRSGNIIPGKASIQVITVGEATSTAAITRASPGRPVVKDDVIANAVYDPDKTFLFLLHGRFDFNGDGRATDAERGLIGNLIADWGGKVAPGEQIRGDLDFLLLGVQPQEPPPLPANPRPIQVDIWLKQKQAVETYNRLLRDAMEAGIPVLNQNRFFVLIGHTYQ